MPSGSRSSKPKPSEVAAETKKSYIPLIRKHYADKWQPYSYLYANPLAQLLFTERPLDVSPPQFGKHISSWYSAALLLADLFRSHLHG